MMRREEQRRRRGLRWSVVGRKELALAATAGLGSLEAKIMDVVWERTDEHLAVRDVLAALDSGLAYTTVMTVMNRLFDKGLLRRRRSGRAWIYTAATSRDAWAAATMGEALRTARDRRGALLHFVADLGPDEAAALRRLLVEDDAT